MESAWYFRKKHECLNKTTNGEGVPGYVSNVEWLTVPSAIK